MFQTQTREFTHTEPVTLIHMGERERESLVDVFMTTGDVNQIALVTYQCQPSGMCVCDIVCYCILVMSLCIAKLEQACWTDCWGAGWE